MTWEQIEERMRRIQDRVKSTWTKLTDDSIEGIAGKQDVLVGDVPPRREGSRPS